LDHRLAALEGSQEAVPSLDTAFRENAAQLYRYIYTKVGSGALAEDLTSEVFLKAARWLRHDRSVDSVRGWLYATARTTVVDHWRKQAQVETLSLDAWEEVLFCGRDPVEETRRTRERAMRLLRSLPEREREVLTLRFLRGYNAAEIGHALGLSPGNVRVLQLRALRRAVALLLDPDHQEGER